MREFGELESAIMDVAWAGDRPYLVREVRERLSYNRPVAYTTVMTVMNILYNKGVLRREKHGRAWRYWPSETREEHDARLMAEVLRSGGDEHLTMLRFVQRVSEEERESLRTAVLRTAVLDAAALDTGVLNTGALDAGVLDTGVLDTGAGVLDTGALDAGVLDAGVLDAGVRNTGVRNTGALDAGVRNTGVRNAGVRNTGVRNTGIERLAAS